MLFTYALLYGIQRDNILFSDLFSHCAFACSILFHGLHFGVCSCFLQLVVPDVSILHVPMLQAQEGKPFDAKCNHRNMEMQQKLAKKNERELAIVPTMGQISIRCI